MFGHRRKKSPGIFAVALKIFFALCFQGFAKNRDKLSRKKRDKRGIWEGVARETQFLVYYPPFRPRWAG